MREALGNPKAIVPAAKTIGGPGCRVMIPLGHIQAAYVRSHFSVAEMTVWDGPRRGEIAFGLAMATRLDSRATRRSGCRRREGRRRTAIVPKI